mgnify:CR=1 FL=1
MNFEPIVRNRSADMFFLGAESNLCIGIFYTMKEKVDGEALAFATEQAIKRLPLFGASICMRNNGFYYANNPLPMVIQEREDAPVAGSPEMNGHLFCVYYHANHICFTLHHSLTDGVGIVRFSETLFYYYYSRLDKTEYPSDGIRVNDEKEHPEVWADPFAKPYPLTQELVPKTPSDLKITQGLVLPRLSEEPGMVKYRFSLPAKAFMDFVKGMETSPAVASSLLMMRSVRSLFMDDTDPIVAKLPVDLRNRLGFSETLRNCVVMKPLLYDPQVLDGLSFKEQATILRSTLRARTTEEELKQTANGYIAFMELIEAQGTIEQKKVFFAKGREPDKTTFLLSYINGYRMNGYGERLLDVSTVEKEPYPKLNIFATGESFFFDFLQPFAGRRYIDALTDELKRHGFAPEIREEEIQLPEADLRSF